MIPISQDEIHHFSDRTSLVWCSINIVNWNGFGELLGMELVALSIVMVNELSGGSAVYKGTDGLHFSCISGFQLNLQFEGGRTVLNRSNDKSRWESLLQFWAPIMVQLFH